MTQSPASQQAAEYLELYENMRRQAEEQASRATPGAATVTVPTPEAFVEALSAAARDAPDSAEEDPEDARRNFVWPGLSLPPSSLLSFRMSAWLPLLRRHTMPTRLLPLPDDFVSYLSEDGVWIPEHLAPVQSASFLGRDNADETAAERRAEAARWRATLEEIDSSDEEEEAAEEAAAAKQRLRESQPFFPELVAQVQSMLTELGGEVFPSLDWHAPTDAAWISTERVAKCRTVGDLLLLLKSSDKVHAEVTEPFELCSPPTAVSNAAAAADGSAAASSAEAVALSASASSPSFPRTLALRKWSTLHPSKLFRCFVHKGDLLAVSQLDGNFYEFLQSESARDALLDAIEGWMEDAHVLHTLQEQLHIDSCVMDVYVDMHDRVWLVKLKPLWPRITDSALFSWRELHQLAQAQQARDDIQAQAQQPADASAAASSSPVSASSGDSGPSAAAAAALSVSVPFRVVSAAGAGLDVLRTVSDMATRFPSDGFDVSDGAAIERWIQRVEHGDLKQEQ